MGCQTVRKSPCSQTAAFFSRQLHPLFLASAFLVSSFAALAWMGRYLSWPQRVYFRGGGVADWAMRWIGSDATFAERLVAFAAVEVR